MHLELPPLTVRIELIHEEIEAALATALTALAAEYKVQIDSVKLELTALTPKRAAVKVHVEARRFIKARGVVSGEAVVDDALGVTIQNLAMHVDGPLALIVEPLVRPRLRQFEGKRFELADRLPPNVAVRDVTLETGAMHRVSAKISASFLTPGNSM